MNSGNICFLVHLIQWAYITKRQHDRTAGYRLLMHAEIEYCLERMVLTAVSECINHATQGLVSETTAALLGSNSVQFTVDDLKNMSPGPVSSLRKRDCRPLQNIQRKFGNVVKTNHGIREWNIYRILLPAGLPKNTIDSIMGGSWLQKIDEFGQQRGDIAHQSGRVYQRPDPRDAYATVRLIVRGVRELDNKLLRMQYQPLNS